MNTSNRSKVLEGFTEVAGSRVNPAVQGWKDGGGKVIGYFCSSVPEEIISAAGLLPVRIRATGSTGTDLADAYFRPTTCSFARHCFDTALRGGYGFADGVVWANTCDVIRRLYDNWKEEIDAPFLQILSLPKKTGPKQVAWYQEELGHLRTALESHFRVDISDERLWESIILHNETRRLQRQLYDLRKGEQPPITGAATARIPPMYWPDIPRSCKQIISGSSRNGKHILVASLLSPFPKKNKQNNNNDNNSHCQTAKASRNFDHPLESSRYKGIMVGAAPDKDIAVCRFRPG